MLFKWSSFATYTRLYRCQTRYGSSSLRHKRSPEARVFGLLEHFKKTSRRSDISDPTHPSSVTILEISELLRDFSAAKGKCITTEEIRNGYQIIKPFLPENISRREQHLLSNVEILGTTHNGDGLAVIPKSMYAFGYADSESLMGSYTVLVIPKTTTGDRVKILLKMHHEFYAEAELISVLNSDSRQTKRNDALILCEHFHECNGCQLQMLSYEEQLKFKQNVIRKAYRYFYPQLEMDQDFGSVVGSPLQYAYRTKLTPHFSMSQGKCFQIGFQHVANRGKVDVEQCPIATREINAKLRAAREKYLGNAPMKQLTLRQSLYLDHKTGEFYPTALEGQKKVITERIEDFVYQFESNCFFQNNNSILSSVLDFIRYEARQLSTPIVNLVDTYCGVGFFGIALSQMQPNLNVFGIEVSEMSIKYAQHNAKLNGLDPQKVQFILGDASDIFNHEALRESKISGRDSVVIVDPSRKGSDEAFMSQLLEFNPAMIVYVSCNVFTQARDLAMFEKLQGVDKRYTVDKVFGFDFFPQTKHIESVAIIKRI
ncbi:uncharacterized protein LODBEIA_P08010 [Lodderomyces beijingensis]|uniref:TRAM domain-containing protein n=1 Tax=Lodderomyces beijingensis TaxID=1775926 RepID=A0ABP0ZGQ4_9ASCO